MDRTFQKFLRSGLDLAPLGVERREENLPYFCTPKGAAIFGWAGIDGIHYCFIRAVVGEARQAPGIEAVPTDLAGVKKVIRNLRAGHTFGALPDQVPSHGDGVWADFFGRPAYTMTLPVRVARQFDAVRIFAWGVRTRNGWKVDAALWDEPLTGDLRKDAAGMNRMIESVIRRIPDQYAWSYNRYKRPRGAPPPEAQGGQ